MVDDPHWYARREDGSCSLDNRGFLWDSLISVYSGWFV